jgi:GNAT superfamily N-acetyltransferase
MELVFTRELATQKLRDEAQSLLVAHWQEIALDQDTVPLDDRWDIYELLENQGALNIMTARTKDAGRLVGYVVHIITVNPHYRSLLVADNDIFWLDPAYRKGMAGVRLLRAAEAECKARGCNKIVLKEKVHRSLGRLMEFMGYTLIERVHAKALR